MTSGITEQKFGRALAHLTDCTAESKKTNLFQGHDFGLRQPSYIRITSTFPQDIEEVALCNLTLYLIYLLFLPRDYADCTFPKLSMGREHG